MLLFFILRVMWEHIEIIVETSNYALSIYFA